MLTNILKAQQFDRQTLEEIFDMADIMKKLLVTKDGRLKLKTLLADKIICNYFHEPSTRTNLSFEAAALRLGASVLNPPFPKQFSSEVKGESFEDSINTISRYADCIVMRHQEEGITEKAAAISKVPIINAGDGGGQHPTQALLDLYTIRSFRDQIDGVSIAMIGDLRNSRTVRSLCYLLGKYEKIKIYFTSPVVVAVREDITDYLTRHNISFQVEGDLREVLTKVDFAYMTRVQEERFEYHQDYKAAVGHYMITPDIMPVGGQVRVMHPLPRDSRDLKLMEISYEMDNDPRSIYFDQVENGLYIRMALLKMVLDYNN